MDKHNKSDLKGRPDKLPGFGVRLTQWEAIFDAITDMVFLLSPNHQILAANKATRDAFINIKDGIIGKQCFHVVHQQDYPIAECPCARAIKTRSTQFSEWKSDGRYYLLSAWPVFSEHGDLELLVHVVKDITEQKTAEENLIEAKTEWEETFNTITDMITVHDKEYNIIRANKAAEKILRLPLLDIIPGAKCFRYYHGTDQPPAGCPSCNCLQTGLPGTYELFEPHLGRFIEIRAIPRFTNDHKLKGLIHVVRDITERKKAEDALVFAKEKAEENDRLKSSFLENISHEIRTPMNQFLGFSEFLKDPDLLPEDRDKYLAIIHKSSHQLLSIIQDVVNISKIESGREMVRTSELHIHDFINNLYLFFKPQADQRRLKLSFHVEVPQKKANIHTDEIKLRTILINLLGNALKFTKEGFVELTVGLYGESLRFTVRDSGIGIAPELHQAIFDRFRQVEISMTHRYGGTGLGLSITKSYAEMLGGHITIDSKLGVGSTFVVSIPYTPGKELPTMEHDKGSNETEVNWSSRTVLLAEDEEDNALYLAKALQPTGIKILFAVNGREAVNLCQQNPAIDLVLMDLKMPEMMGLEAVRKIKLIRPELPIIATTAYALSGDRERALASGCTDYLPKPIFRDMLYNVLNKYLPPLEK